MATINQTQLPDGWRVARLSEAFKFTQKPRSLRYSDYERLPLVPMELIPLNGLYFNDFLLKAVSEISSGTYFEQGDVLVAKITPSFENGKQGIIENLPNHFGIATTEVIPMNGITGVSDKLFLFYYLLRSEIRSELAGKMEGSTGRQRLSKSTLENLHILLPPLPEQHAIAHALRAIQEAKEARQRELSLERERKAALMHYLFTHGTRGEARKQTELGEMPESWKLVLLDDVFEAQLGKMLSQKAKTGQNPKPYVRNANVQWGRVDCLDIYEMDFNERETEKFRLKYGDILVCEGGEVGRTAIWRGELPECYFQKAIHRLRPRHRDMNSDFFLHWMERAFLFANIYGVAGTKTTIAHLPQEKLTAMRIPKPLLDEQDFIASTLNACDAKIYALEKELALLEELFKAMLEELMTGRLSAVPLVEAEG